MGHYGFRTSCLIQMMTAGASISEAKQFTFDLQLSCCRSDFFRGEALAHNDFENLFLCLPWGYHYLTLAEIWDPICLDWPKKNRGHWNNMNERNRRMKTWLVVSIFFRNLFSSALTNRWICKNIPCSRKITKRTAQEATENQEKQKRMKTVPRESIENE